MTIRCGFVSNSSSTSFIIFGAKIPMKELAQKLLGIDIDNPSLVPGCECEFDRSEMDHCPRCQQPTLVAVKLSPTKLSKAIEDKGLHLFEGDDTYDMEDYVGIGFRRGMNGEEVIEMVTKARETIKQIFDRDAEVLCVETV